MLTTDHLGSPRVVTDQDGRVTSRRDYTAFGEESLTPERAAGLGYEGQSETRKGYTGYEKDAESGLDFAQARYYNPTHGRFTSVDPLTGCRFSSFLLSWFENKSNSQNATVFDGSRDGCGCALRLATWATLIASSPTTPAGCVGC